MVAPTAKKTAQRPIEPVEPVVEPVIESDDEVMITADSVEKIDTNIDRIDSVDETSLTIDLDGRPRFPSVDHGSKIKMQMRSIQVPQHRFAPLKANWRKIYTPLVEHLKLQLKMEVRSRKILMRTCAHTTDPGAIQKGDDFVRAFILGFDIEDAVALLRLDDLYIETFEVKDVKTLEGDHLSRAIGRIAGKDGKTKFAIENASRTRVVLADSKIHILGGFTNIKIARETIVSLILGAQPGKVYGNLRIISSRMKERY